MMAESFRNPNTQFVNAIKHRIRQPIARTIQCARDYWRGETEQTYYDLHNVDQINSLLSQANKSQLDCDPKSAEHGVTEAARYIASILISNRQLHQRFPAALTDGYTGTFAQWLIQQGNRQFGLSDCAIGNIRGCFQKDLSSRTRRVFEIRDDLRQAWPLALTPKQRGIYLRWLLTQGYIDFQLMEHEVLWYILELEEDPSYGLETSFRVLPEWQAAVPHGLTRFGWKDLKQWISQQYQFQCRWLRTARLVASLSPCDELLTLQRVLPETVADLPVSASDIPAWLQSHPQIHRLADSEWIQRLEEEYRNGTVARPGINVIGLFRYTSGLQQAAKSTVESLTRHNIRTSLRDYPDTFLRELRDTDNYNGIETYDITILNTGIDIPTPSVYHHCGLYARPDVYRISTWWWELETIPAQWQDRADAVDEIWAPTEFIAQTMRTLFRKPVIPMPPGVTIPVFEPRHKSDFGLDPNRMTYLFIFDMNSRMQRKNPLAVIQAFRQAFQHDELVELVIKVSPQEQFYTDHWNQLREIARNAGVRLIDRMLSRSDLLALMNCADCYVSLHRSEGFGLTCAESMLLGKPVIATGYSGNLEFMNPGNSLLVSYDRVEILEEIPPYPRGAVWAEPHIEHAAELMRWVYQNPRKAAIMAAKGKVEVTALLTPETAGQRMIDRLRQIQHLRNKPIR